MEWKFHYSMVEKTGKGRCEKILGTVRPRRGKKGIVQFVLFF
jgi:hypothetical protein